MPSLRQSCSWRLTLSRAAPTNTPSCSCEICTSEPKSDASAQSRRASRDRQRLQHQLLHPLAHPANPLAQQLDQLDRDARFTLQMAQEIFAAQHEQFGRLAGGGIGGAALAVEHGDLAEQIAGSEKIQRQPVAIGGTGFDVNLGRGGRRTRRRRCRPSGTAPRRRPAAGCGRGPIFAVIRRRPDPRTSDSSST